MIGLSIKIKGNDSDNPEDALVYNPNVNYTGVRATICTGIIWQSTWTIDLIQYNVPDEINRLSFQHDRVSLYQDRKTQDEADGDFILGVRQYAHNLKNLSDGTKWLIKASEWGIDIKTWTAVRFSPLGLVIKEAI